jgi:NAD(P)-dependent dehydrogenase (short-subunit alcohol dehydrogenase family)
MGALGDLLDGRVAIITGGAKWLGASEVEQFVVEGARGVVLDQLASEASKLSNGWYAIDSGVRDPDSIRQALGDVKRTFNGLGAVDARHEAGASTDLGRIVTVREVAKVVLLLASGLSRGITGDLLPVDGRIL